MERLQPVTDEAYAKCNKFNLDIVKDFIDNSTELSRKVV